MLLLHSLDILVICNPSPFAIDLDANYPVCFSIQHSIYHLHRTTMHIYLTFSCDISLIYMFNMKIDWLPLSCRYVCMMTHIVHSLLKKKIISVKQWFL